MAAYARLSNVPVIEARVLMPRVGAWTADLRTDASAAPSGKQVLVLGGVTLACSVRQAVVYRGSVQVRVVGGANGLSTELPAKGYISSPLRVPLQDIATESGETLSPRCDTNVTLVQLRHWMRLAGPAGHALGTLVSDVEGAAWRFHPDGTLWVGQETWPSSDASVEAVAFNPLADKVTFFSTDPRVFPGQTWADRRVGYVEHFVEPERIETHVWFEEAA